VVEELTDAWPADEFPHLRELLLERVVHTGPADEGAFTFGLDLLLDGLDRARRAEARVTRRA
jgi:hypothetical protein